MGGLIPIVKTLSAKFISQDTSLPSGIYKISKAGSTVLVTAKYSWDRRFVIFAISGHNNGHAKFSWIVTESDTIYIPIQAYNDSAGSIYIKSQGNGTMISLLSLVGEVFIEKTTISESELTELTGIVS